MALKKKRDLSAGFSPVPTNAIGSSPNQSNVLGGTPPLGRRNAAPIGTKAAPSNKPVTPENLKGIVQDPGIGNEPLFVGNRQVSAQEFTANLEASRLVAEGGRRALPTPEQLAASGIQAPREGGFTPSPTAPEMTRGLPELVAERFRNPFGPTPPEMSTVKGGVRTGIIEPLFVALDLFRQFGSRATGLGSKKPLTLAQAEESFSDVMGSLRLDMADINAGLQDPTATRIKLIQAQNAINSYERYQKNYGWANLAYWADEGAQMEGQLLVMKEALAELETDLALAKQTWLQRQFNVGFPTR